jgi:hypothetical protein
MTFAQSRLAVLNLLRKIPFLRGFKASDFGPGTMIYFPYIPLYMTADLPMTPEELADTRRQLAENHRRVEAHIADSRNVDLTVQ